MFRDKFIDKYSFVRDPDGPPGDSFWQSCWLFGAYCVSGHSNRKWDYICQNWDGDPIGTVGKFLENVPNCFGHDYMCSHPERRDHNSRDQWLAFIWLAGCIYKYQPHLIGLVKPILNHAEQLCQKYGRLHPIKDGRAKIGNNIRYLMSVLNKKYNVPHETFSDKWFCVSLYGYEKSWAWNFVPRGWKADDYSIWNNVGAVASLKCLGVDISSYRDYFKTYAKKGWGPGFELIWRGITPIEFEQYKDKTMQHLGIFHEKGPNHLAESGWDRPSFDYLILNALYEVML